VTSKGSGSSGEGAVFVIRSGRYGTIPLQTSQVKQYTMKKAAGLTKKFKECHVLYSSQWLKLRIQMVQKVKGKQ
jgi:hypothetical protein